MNLLPLLLVAVLCLDLVALSHEEGGDPSKNRSAGDFINELTKLLVQSRQRYPSDFYNNDYNDYNQIQKKPYRKPKRPNYYSQYQDAGYAPGYGFTNDIGYDRPGYPNKGYRKPNYNYNQGVPRPDYPNQGFPRPEYPNQGFSRPDSPSQGFLRPEYPNQGFPRPDYPSQGFPRPGYPGQYNDQGYPGDAAGFGRPGYPGPYPDYPSGGFGDDPNAGYPPDYDPYLEGPPYPPTGPLGGFSDALSSIARYDDMQCVPRLLCEVAAGGNPSQRYPSYLSYLPSMSSMESLFTLLSAFTNSRLSPFLIFGRAALMGVSSQGNPSSCRYAYPQCPRDPDQLVDYLNNHNGGFFRFFNGVQQQQQQQQQQQGPGSFNFPQDQQSHDQQYPQRPPYPYQQGNYNRYQYKNGDNATDIAAEARIQNKPTYSQNELYLAQSYYYPSVIKSNGDKSWKFPEAASNSIQEPTHLKFPDRRPKGLAFPDDDVRNQEVLFYPKPLPFYDHSKMIFPDRTGTGNLKFDSGKIGNDNRGPQYFPPEYYGNNNYYNNPGSNVYSQQNRYQDNGYQSSKKNYIYVVRDDPNHPEIIMAKHGAQQSDGEERSRIDRNGTPWTFPSTYEGVIYNE